MAYDKNYAISICIISMVKLWAIKVSFLIVLNTIVLEYDAKYFKIKKTIDSFLRNKEDILHIIYSIK